MRKKLIILLLLVAIVTPPAAFANGESNADGNLTLLTNEQMSRMIGGEDLCGYVGTVMDGACETLSDGTKWLWEAGEETVTFVLTFVKFKPKGLDEFEILGIPGIGTLVLDIAAILDWIFGQEEDSASSTECPPDATDPQSADQYDSR